MGDIVDFSRINDAGTLSRTMTAYEFDYFSGAQISIYIGDILVDDIEHIQFNVTQTKRPIYGYASQYFHTVADGQILVEGTFSIPFKEADYIIATLDNYMAGRAPIEEIENKGGSASKSSREYNVLRENIERRIDSISKGYTEVDLFEFANNLSALPDELFENMAEQFEDVLWKRPKENFMEPNLKYGLSGLDSSHSTRRGDQFPFFDIYVLYGDIVNGAANHTIKKLIDCSIIGQGQAIMASGEPIRESYRFIGRNLA